MGTERIQSFGRVFFGFFWYCINTYFRDLTGTFGLTVLSMCCNICAFAASLWTITIFGCCVAGFAPVMGSGLSTEKHYKYHHISVHRYANVFFL